jgi:hypothetical protein
LHDHYAFFLPRPVAFYVRNDNRATRLVKLIATCGALDINDPQTITRARRQSGKTAGCEFFRRNSRWSFRASSNFLMLRAPDRAKGQRPRDSTSCAQDILSVLNSINVPSLFINLPICGWRVNVRC